MVAEKVNIHLDKDREKLNKGIDEVIKEICKILAAYVKLNKNVQSIDKILTIIYNEIK